MHLDAVGHSIKAPSKRCNQDQYLIDQSLRFVIVADGMGGHRGGEIASRIAVDSLSRYLDLAYESHLSNSYLLQEGFKKAHEAVLAMKQTDNSLDSMGTTLIALLLRHTPGSDVCSLANVGDSRLYLACGDSLSLETVDDTLVQQAVNEGKLTITEAEQHPLRHVLTQCIGQTTGDPTPAIKDLRIDDGSIVILCTDGLHQCLDLSFAIQAINTSGNIHGDCVGAARKVLRGLLGITPTDDATAVVVEFSAMQTTIREKRLDIEMI